MIKIDKIMCCENREEVQEQLLSFIDNTLSMEFSIDDYKNEKGEISFTCNLSACEVLPYLFQLFSISTKRKGHNYKRHHMNISFSHFEDYTSHANGSQMTNEMKIIIRKVIPTRHSKDSTIRWVDVFSYVNFKRIYEIDVPECRKGGYTLSLSPWELTTNNIRDEYQKKKEWS